MSDKTGLVRPRQVTTAAWVAGGASVAMLVSVGDLIVKLKTVDLRQSLADFLASQGSAVAGVSVDEALVVARIGLMVTGAAAAATLVFAYFVAQRDRTARIAMTVLAVPLLVCGVFVDVFLTGFIVMSTVLLWTGPATDWFAGRAPRLAPATATGPPPPPRAPTPAHRESEHPPTRAADTQPAPYRATYGDATPTPTPVAPYAGRASGTRPRQLLVACVLTWVGSVVVAAFMVLAVVALQTSQARTELSRLIADNPAATKAGLSVDQLATFTTVAAAVIVLWAIGASVVAAFALSGQAWARVVLLVSAIAAGLVALLGSFAFPGFLLLVLAGFTSAVLLCHRDVSAWYAGPPRVEPPRPW